MSDQESPSQISPEERVARLFESAGYDVSREVGLDPGTVDFFATARTGFVRPRTYWKVWEKCPQDLEGALKELDRARVARGADRALGVVMQGPLPALYVADLKGHTTNAASFRYLMLQLSGIEDKIRDFVHQYESSREHLLYLRRSGRLSNGEVVDAVTHIDEWVRSEERGHLALLEPSGLSRRSVVREACYRLGVKFRDNPEAVTPLVENPSEGLVPVFLEGYAVPVVDGAYFDRDLVRRALVIGHGDGDQTGARTGGLSTIELLPVTQSEVEAWFKQNVSGDIQEIFFSAFQHGTPFRELLRSPGLLPALLDSVLAVAVLPQMSTAEWIARVAESYVLGVLKQGEKSSVYSEMVELLERGALEQFVVGSPVLCPPGWEYRAVLEQIAEPLWLELSWDPPWVYSVNFKNILIRDYFIARRVANAVRQGAEITTHQQFPREYVLLFLAIIDPEAARVTAERSAELRAAIEGEVERRLQLTLAHMLRRSAGAVRSHIQSLRRRLSAQQENELLHEFSRLEEEVAFQLALAERTRLLREMPEQQLECVTVAELLHPVARQLREQYAQVQCVVETNPSLRVRASREGLREVLACLLENAFQAVAFAQGLTGPRVAVRASQEGDVVRIDVLDNGPGVAPADRERIFEPYVSTKKGGGKPLGTGMGLAIARRYAQHMGGRVALDARSAETCFYVQLVAWKD